MSEPPVIPPKPKYLIAKIAGPEGLAKFIRDLEDAAEDSRNTGGGYSAFLKLADGRVLQVEINPKKQEDRQ